MEGIIANFRGGRHTKSDNQMIVEVDLKREKCKELIGKKVIWITSAKKEIKGIVTNLHGNNSRLRVRFERGMPGQAIGTKVKIE